MNFIPLFLMFMGLTLTAEATKRKPSSGLGHPHVLLMHMDGTSSDVFKAMVDSGQLPHYKYLLERGKINYNNSTVDKSETMKVILSYLTSAVDTEVVGWWQFNRENFGFRNFWIDPIEVVNYALGLEFPRRPTIHDFLAADGKTTLSGFGLHRRSVAFDNYSRAYFEGYTYGVLNHQYLNQSHASMDGLISKYIGNAEKNVIPSFTHGLLAPADEFGHLDGIIDDGLKANGRKFVTQCYDRAKKKEAKEKSQTEIFFQYLDDMKKSEMSSVVYVDKRYQDGKISAETGKGHFHSVKKKGKKTTRFCIDAPVLDFYADDNGGKKKAVTHPLYVLGMISMDIQMGRLLNTLQSLKLSGCQESKPAKDVCYMPSSKGLAGLIADRGEDSLFGQTLFVFTGDHGIADTKAMMAKCEKGKCIGDDHGRGKNSLDTTFIELLNSKLAFGKEIKSPTDRMGIDDTNIPNFIKYPHLDAEWVKSAGLENEVKEAKKWSLSFFQTVRNTIKNELSRKYWYLLFLKKPLVYNRLDSSLEPYKEGVLTMFESLYLKSMDKYKKAEVEYLREKYEQHISFVYGGGAKNNAEFFFPREKDGKYSWDKRPGFDEILKFKGNANESFVEILRKMESVGVVFIRKNNPLENSRYGRMEIAVYGKEGSEGLIYVERNRENMQLVYGYKVLTEKDPLKLGESKNAIRWGTYNEWNDHSVDQTAFYHNPVAGVGSYMYSVNPSIGDIFVTAGFGWNFGDNSGGHGGIQADEKKTILMVSGPDIAPGTLMGQALWKTEGRGNGEYRLVKSPHETNTTVLDIAPTVLSWLGYENGALDEFGNSSKFRKHMQNWVKTQRGEVQANYADVEDLHKIFEWASFGGINIKPLDPYIKRLLEFIPTAMPELEDTEKNPAMGNVLMIPGTQVEN